MRCLPALAVCSFTWGCEAALLTRVGRLARGSRCRSAPAVLPCSRPTCHVSPAAPLAGTESGKSSKGGGLAGWLAAKQHSNPWASSRWGSAASSKLPSRANSRPQSRAGSYAVNSEDEDVGLASERICLSLPLFLCPALRCRRGGNLVRLSGPNTSSLPRCRRPSQGKEGLFRRRPVRRPSVDVKDLTGAGRQGGLGTQIR